MKYKTKFNCSPYQIYLNHFENVLKFRKGLKKNHLLESSAKGVGASTPASIKKIDFSSQREKINVENALKHV